MHTDSHYYHVTPLLALVQLKCYTQPAAASLTVDLYVCKYLPRPSCVYSGRYVLKECASSHTQPPSLLLCNAKYIFRICLNHLSLPPTDRLSLSVFCCRLLLRLCHPSASSPTAMSPLVCIPLPFHSLPFPVCQLACLPSVSPQATHRHK